MRNKFGAIKTDYNGIKYDSRKEAAYAQTLDLCKKAVGKSDRVVEIERQLPYLLEVNGVKICKYILDFKVKYADGRTEYIDVKGVLTPVYKLKKKLVKAIHNIDIKEV